MPFEVLERAPHECGIVAEMAERDIARMAQLGIIIQKGIRTGKRIPL